MTLAVSITNRRSVRFDATTWLSLYVVLLLFVPSRLVLGPLGSAGAPSMVFGLGSLLLWVFARAGAWRSIPTGVQPIRIALVLFLLSVGVSYLLAMAGPMSFDEISPADVALLAVASWSGTLLMAHDGSMDANRLRTLIWRISVCAGIIGLLGIAQVLTGQVWVDRISIPGLTQTSVAGTFIRGAFPRPAGTAIHPIEFGVLISMLLPIALHVGFHFKEHRAVVRWLPALVLAAIVPVTSSRSAYLGAVVGLVICFVGWTAPQRKVVATIGAVGLAAMLVVTPNLTRSIVGMFSDAAEDPSITSRTGSFDLAAEFIAIQPWFGRGLGTFLPKYRIFDNQYLVLLVTIGIVGTMAFLALGIVAVVALLRTRARTKDGRDRDLQLSLIAAICVGFASLSVFDAFAFPMTMGTLFLLLGIAGAVRRISGGVVGIP